MLRLIWTRAPHVSSGTLSLVTNSGETPRSDFFTGVSGVISRSTVGCSCAMR
ncbi:MAG TPA: hypothetical protein VJ749_03290 [Pyrinomonadaceae bacterium]|nr:hypothetical protein [Pyrinomonadaceae bacterium]